MMLCRLLYDHPENVGKYFSETSMTSWLSTRRHIRENFNSHQINLTVGGKENGTSGIFHVEFHHDLRTIYNVKVK